MTNDLIERLRNPAWSHSEATFESPQLDKDENVTAMTEAAHVIEVLRGELLERCKANSALHKQLAGAKAELKRVADKYGYQATADVLRALTDEAGKP